MKRINITCPACGSRAYLRPASVVYGDKAPDPDAKYYVCGRYPACDCYVAAHRKTMLPMGTLADKALRKKRHDAHVALDSLWKNGIMSRKEAYRGKYYTLTDQRIPYRRDKTEDERFFILTLFAIAHEIEAMGQYSGSLMRVQLAVGLPPAHFGVQAKRFINYFNGRGAVAFQFKGKPYAIFIENTACFPQSFSAAAATVKNLASFPRALVVDIGGFTADYVRLRNGVPDMAACDSLENGVILLYNRICAKANAELDILLEESEIDRILRGEDQDAAPDVIALAEREAQEFINDLLSGLRERMLELKSGKVIFLGGGATLLRRQIETSGKIGQAIFVEDINANAKGYEYLYRLQHSGR